MTLVCHHEEASLISIVGETCTHATRWYHSRNNYYILNSWRGPDGNCNPILSLRRRHDCNCNSKLIHQKGPAVTVISFSFFFFNSSVSRCAPVSIHICICIYITFTFTLTKCVSICICTCFLYMCIYMCVCVCGCCSYAETCACTYPLTDT